MSERLRAIKDVRDWGLCTGCGACTYACPNGEITLENVPSAGIRPRILDESYDSSELLSICPGASVIVPINDKKSPERDLDRLCGRRANSICRLIRRCADCSFVILPGTARHGVCSPYRKGRGEAVA